MGCKKLTYYESQSPLKVVYRKTEPQQKVVQRFLSVDPMAHEREWLSPYNYCQDNPIMRIDPDGALDTYYKDKEGNLLMETDDGKTDEVTVSDENVKDFKKMGEMYSQSGMKEYFDSPGFNNYWRGEFGASTDVGEVQKEGIEILKENWANWTDEEGAMNDFFENPTLSNYWTFAGKRILNQHTNPLNYMPSPKIKAKRNLKPNVDFNDLRQRTSFGKGHFKGKGQGYASKAHGAIYRMAKARTARANAKINKAATRVETISNGIIVVVPKPEKEE